mgnify:CR=1 FL=1
MEHRCSVRLPVAMNVLLYHNNIPVVHCKTSDISPDGMFVQSGPLKYKANTLLKVELGLMFPGSDAEAMLAWHDMVRRIVTQASKGEDDLSVNTSSTLVFDNKNKETKAEHKEVLLT